MELPKIKEKENLSNKWELIINCPSPSFYEIPNSLTQLSNDVKTVLFF